MTTTDRTGCRLGRLGLMVTMGIAASVAVAQEVPQTPFADGAYKAKLLPVNNSGVSGEALMVPSADGTQLTVIVAARNLEPGQVHPQHIHGLEDGSVATCATLAQDVSGEHLLTLDESGPVHGPAIVPLEPFPTADDGTVNYGLTLDAAGLGTVPLTHRVVELHGMTVPGQGYIETLPIACGEIVTAFAQRPESPSPVPAPPTPPTPPTDGEPQPATPVDPPPGSGPY